MNISTALKVCIKATPLAVPYIWCKNAFGKDMNSQSNEARIIDRLTAEFDVPRSFIEFGFSGWEFNCIKLAGSADWEGLLIDGDSYNVRIANQIFSKRTTARQLWITLETVESILEYSRAKKIGILSIDVDGNDYWFLKKLIPIRPAVIIVEFNVSFGLRPISVPYDSRFDRSNRKHKSREYYGASVSAFHYLCSGMNYSLVEISRNGINGFFVRNDLLGNDARKIVPDQISLRKLYPDGSVAPSARFWEEIKDLPYVDVTRL